MSLSSVLTELRIGAFKSYRDQLIRLEPITILIGRNGSGKSNALDALSLLALLADERDVNDLERGDSEVGGLRGGLTGAAPFGGGTIKVGCTLRRASGSTLSFEVELDPKSPEIITERLVESKSGKVTTLISAGRTQAGSGIAHTEVYSGKMPRQFNLLSSRLAVAQALTKVPEDSDARKRVVAACRDLVDALRGVFVLDPVPAQMREYVRIGAAPDRAGSTVSALAYRLRDDAEAWTRLNDLVSGLVESEATGLSFLEGRFPDQPLADVMVAMTEIGPNGQFVAPARLMSDGSLRYLSIVSSLLYLRTTKHEPLTGPRTLVVEEIENGLFPNQAARVLDLLREEASTQGVRLMCTTHSPALLDVLRPEDHRGVVVCDRDSSGLSRARRLVDHPRYVELAGGGRIGQAITRGELSSVAPATRSLSDLFAS